MFLHHPPVVVPPPRASPVRLREFPSFPSLGGFAPRCLVQSSQFPRRTRDAPVFFGESPVAAAPRFMRGNFSAFLSSASSPAPRGDQKFIPSLTLSLPSQGRAKVASTISKVVSLFMCPAVPRWSPTARQTTPLPCVPQKRNYIIISLGQPSS